MITENTSTSEIMDLGFSYLIEKLGVIGAERFISVVIRERADYTKWRQEYFGDVSSEDFQKAAVAYGKENPL